MDEHETDPYADFKFSGETFRDKIGEPEEFDAALGRIVLAFSYLEDSVRDVISLLLGTDIKVGAIVSAELGFRQKLDVLGSLVWLRLETGSSHDASAKDTLKKLLRICRQSEELRNQHLHLRSSGASSRSTTQARV
jgi:hypothetical protein